jgi:DNA-binding NtrC family response regulator
LYVFELPNSWPDVGLVGTTLQNVVLVVLYRVVPAKRAAIDASNAVLYAAEPTAPANGVAYASDPNDQVANGLDSDEGVDLQAVVKDAVLRLERDAIAQALVRFRWNRRKAASHLRVSYKTLLNKMKECGISEPGTS